MLLAELVATSNAVAATRSRLAKVEAIASCLRRADPDEIALTVRYLSGELRQRRSGIGWAALRDLPSPAGEPSLDLVGVDRFFADAEALSGPGSVGARRGLVEALMGRATESEQRFLLMLVGGELRQGALAGIMTDAVARAAAADPVAVRRAAMLAGDLGAVAAAALVEGTAGLQRFALEVGRPLQPMLAQSAPDIESALTRVPAAAIDWKVDGIRVQVHRDNQQVAVFTRTLDLITARVPEIVEAALSLPGRRLVLDGEAIALASGGRPRPFQETAARTATKTATKSGGRMPLTPFFFDVLHLDGNDLIDRPAAERFAALDALVPERWRVPRLVTADAAAATDFFRAALEAGYEGVVVKALDSTYEAGRRGAGWVKVKPHHTLDLVVLAAEWGHGRRQGWLSNLHLGARDPETGGFVMLGKTFKGLTD
ncbi:MAG TPA: ATP-dependent DNA ligase, partial [Acidimicrobiales bacterium]|nr:ATP-dependent DNA ligase [Acidimicrobiales bacterium]